MRLALALIIALCCSAATCQRRAPEPQIVTVTVTEFVPVPDALTAPCYDEAPREQTHGEAKRLANLRHDALTECSGRMGEIRALGRKP